MLRTASLSLVLALLALAAASWLTQGFRVWTAEGARRLAVLEHPVTVPAVWLAGPALRREPWHSLLAGPGRVTLVNFFYTRCTTICVALGSTFQQMQRQIGPAADGGVLLLSISFDSVHDDLPQLQRYAQRWGADPARWQIASVAVGGDGPSLPALLQALQVTVVADGLGGYEHNAALLVIDGQGRLVRIFEADETDAALAFARLIR